MQAVDRPGLASVVIRTPDQRLRVFISSTLVEMAAERAVARGAVESLRLAPVMFELGARPHPPRDLYRAYLEQSDVFLGLYWEKYGWVAPTEEVSGLEDEYNLAGTLPRLIYVKNTDGSREPRLVELLGRIRADDRASYKYFSTAEELEDLIKSDLATLLAERFDQSRIADAAGSTAPAAPTLDASSGELPAALDSLVGRANDVASITGLLREPNVRLVTLTGPGGIGKSRLAVDAARQSKPAFRDGVFFVSLAAVQNPAEVPAAIAQALGVHDRGDGPIVDTIQLALRNRELLLVLDNFEQVLEAGSGVVGMLAASPGITALVTSRAPLRVRGERVFPVQPLSLPTETESDTASALQSAAVQLFVERARAAKPDFELTEANVSDVARICIALDGLPLAIELVAARIRLLQPAAMIERLGQQLGALVGSGIRDLPGRQQTLLSTVTWSTDLLAPEEVRLLTELGSFAGGFSLEAAENVASRNGDRDTLDVLEALVDSSLVRQHDRDGGSYFTILSTVREWARAQLIADDRLDQVCSAHAGYYLDLSARLELELEGPRQIAVARSLATEHENLRASVGFLLDVGRDDDAANLCWNLYLYWWVDGHLGEVSRWMDRLLSMGRDESARTRAIALYFTKAITFWSDFNDQIMPGLTESAARFHEVDDKSGEALSLISLALALLAGEPADAAGAKRALDSSLSLFQRAGDRWGEAFALITLGRLALLVGDSVGALEQFERSLALTRTQGDQLGEGIALHHIGWVRFLQGDIRASEGSFRQSLELSIRLGHAEGTAYGLEGLVAIAAAADDLERAGALMGAAQSLRRQSGLYNAPSFSFHEQAVARFTTGERAEEFRAARHAGLAMPLADALALARDSSHETVSDAQR